MNRSELIAKLGEQYPKVGQKGIDAIVRSLFDSMVKNIADGERIEIRGFGCFSLKERVAGTVRNPRKGISMESSARNVVYFRAGKELKERVNIINK